MCIRDRAVTDNEALSFAQILANQIADNGLKNGTSITTSMAELTIHGKTYQVQIRLESSRADFIENGNMIEAVGLGSTGMN